MLCRNEMYTYMSMAAFTLHDCRAPRVHINNVDTTNGSFRAKVLSLRPSVPKSRGGRFQGRPNHSRVVYRLSPLNAYPQQFVNKSSGSYSAKVFDLLGSEISSSSCIVRRVWKFTDGYHSVHLPRTTRVTSLQFHTLIHAIVM